MYSLRTKREGYGRAFLVLAHDGPEEDGASPSDGGEGHVADHVGVVVVQDGARRRRRLPHRPVLRVRLKG